MADYRNSSGIVIEDGPNGPTLTIEDSTRVDPGSSARRSAPRPTVPSGSPSSAAATDRPAADRLGATAATRRFTDPSTHSARKQP